MEKQVIDFFEIMVALIGIPIIGFSMLFIIALFGVVGIAILATFPFLIFGFFA
jgi:hypothetical protein